MAIQHRIEQIKALSQQQQAQAAAAALVPTNGSVIISPSTPVVVAVAVAATTATATDLPQPRKTNMLAASSFRSLSTAAASTSKSAMTSLSSTKSASSTTTTGGRKGGRKTNKNVPYTRTGDKGTSQLLTGERRIKSDLVFDAMGTVDELCSITGIVHSMLLMEQQKQPAQQQQQENAKGVTQQTTMTAQDSLMENNNDNDDDDIDNKVDLNEWLLEIMSRLFDIGTHIANPQKRQVRSHHDENNNNGSSSDEEVQDDNDNNKDNNVNNINGIGGGFDPTHIEVLEDWIDIMTEQLPVLHSFILPTSGAITLATSHLHQARCVCRRAERSVVQLMNNQHSAVNNNTIAKDKDGVEKEDSEDIYYYYVYDERAVHYLNRLSDFYFTAARWVHYDRAAALGMDGEQQEILYRRPFRGAKQRNRTTQKG
jgi:cob(I)alamin adenosyltransferase